VILKLPVVPFVKAPLKPRLSTMASNNNGDMFFLEQCIRKRIASVYRSSKRFWSKKVKELQDKIDLLEKQNSDLISYIKNIENSPQLLSKKTELLNSSTTPNAIHSDSLTNTIPSIPLIEKNSDITYLTEGSYNKLSFETKLENELTTILISNSDTNEFVITKDIVTKKDSGKHITNLDIKEEHTSNPDITEKIVEINPLKTHPEPILSLSPQQGIKDILKYVEEEKLRIILSNVLNPDQDLAELKLVSNELKDDYVTGEILDDIEEYIEIF